MLFTSISQYDYEEESTDLTAVALNSQCGGKLQQECGSEVQKNDKRDTRFDSHGQSNDEFCDSY